jgi:two-component system phosphate regulon sensor histidine kinase PhoR
MKSKIHLVLLLITIISLAVLVGIQISWMLKAAKMQEDQFKQAVSLVMNRTVENLASNKVFCNELAGCISEGEIQSCFAINHNRIVFKSLDSLIRNELRNLNIDLDFEFELVEKGTVQECPYKKNVFVHKNLENIAPNSGFELSIRFPEKKEFIKAQMGSIFISSIALLLLVCVSIVLIYRFLEHERRLTRNIIDFINNITHEIKTPLTNIALASSIISKHEVITADEKLVAYTKVIRNEHKNMKDKIEMMLKATLLESDIPMEINQFSAYEEVCSVVDTFSVQLDQRQGRISIEKSGDNFMLLGNADLFRIAIGNLIDNAIKYCSVEPEIKVELDSKGKQLRICISDNGIGIPKKHHSRIFDRYYRVTNGDVHCIDGFGLGLYLVRSTVTKMNGQVDVSSTEGKGSVFIIKLPLA